MYTCNVNRILLNYKGKSKGDMLQMSSRGSDLVRFSALQPTDSIAVIFFWSHHHCNSIPVANLAGPKLCYLETGISVLLVARPTS